MKKGFGWGAVLLVVIGLAAGTIAADVQIVDQTGRTVEISQPVERLISVYGFGTYFVYALGASDRLELGWYVGLKKPSQVTETMLRFEPRLESIMRSGTPNVEEMVAYGTDLILVDGSRHGAFADQMTDLGVPVIQYAVESPEALEEAMRITGVALGADAEARAESYVADLERIMATIDESLADVEDTDRPRVLFVGTDPLKVASGDMFQTTWIERAGGVSVSAGLGGSWNDVNLEQVLVWDPDVIVIAPYGPVQPSQLLESPDWAAIQAVRDGRVVRMPRIIGPMDTPVPEALVGLLWMAEVFHPAAVSLDIAEEITRFYSVYYGFELTDEELQGLLP